MAALSLHKSIDSAKLDTRGDISRPMEGAKKAAEGVAQKFSIGVTLPKFLPGW